MIKEKISSQEIIDLVSSKSKVSKRVAEDFLKVMISSIEDALLAGEVVKIKNFGTFKLQWNEPRKSVNVHSGEDILLAGYHKVTFTPDVILKDLVNEPFAHLMPVEFDSENPEPIQEKTDVALDPLHIFSDQASEIKDLLSEIQALSPKIEPKEDVPVVSEHDSLPIELVDYQVREKPVVEQTQNEQQSEVHIPELTPEQIKEAEAVVFTPEVAEEFVHEKPVIEDAPVKDIPDYFRKEAVVQQPTESVIYHQEERINYQSRQEEQSQTNDSVSEFDSTEFLKDISPKRKRRVWLTILIIVVLFVGTGAGLYLFSPPVNNFVLTTATNAKAGVLKASENISITDMFNTISGWFTPKAKLTPVVKTIVVPKDTTANDSVDAKEPVDSLQLLFDNPRVYKTFIATETVKPNGRLTIMSKKYYGSKDFWVYIYEANKDRIPNPDKISKGTLIHIPKLDSKLIDVANPRCIKKAKELHDIYVKKAI